MKVVNRLKKKKILQIQKAITTIIIMRIITMRTMKTTIIITTRIMKTITITMKINLEKTIIQEKIIIHKKRVLNTLFYLSINSFAFLIFSSARVKASTIFGLNLVPLFSLIFSRILVSPLLSK